MKTVFKIVSLVTAIIALQSCKKCQECEVLYLNTPISARAEYCDDQLNNMKAVYPWDETTKSGFKCY